MSHTRTPEPDMDAHTSCGADQLQSGSVNLQKPRPTTPRWVATHLPLGSSHTYAVPRGRGGSWLDEACETGMPVPVLVLQGAGDETEARANAGVNANPS